MKQYMLYDMTCVVTVVSPRGLEGTQKLVAFVTNGGFRVLPDAGQMHSLRLSSDEADLIRESLLGMTAHLASSLPSYMIPSLYFPCAFIPTSMSSKIDRKILAEYGAQIMMEDPQNCIPGEIDSRNETKRTLRATDGHLGEQLKLLWSKLLKRDADTLNPKGHYFNLGGDSIAATRLVNEAKSVGITISVKDVFQNPTLEALAAIAVRNREQEPKELTNGQMNGEQSENLRTDPDNILVTLRSQNLDLEQCTECPDIQAFMVVSSLLKPRGYFTYFSFDINGSLNVERLEKACHNLVHRHSVLRTVFDIQSGRIFQKVLKTYPLEFAQLTSKEASPSLIARMCQAEKQCESRLGDTIVRFVLVKRGIDQYILIMRICHSQFDGHSLGVIYRDLQAAYQERLHTDPAASFSDFSKASSEANDHRAVSYWRQLLQGSSMTSILKHFKPPSSNVINDRVTMHFPIKPPQLPEVTLATIVKAAWGKVLAEFSGLNDVVFGYAVTTRNLPLIGIEEVVGPCNNAALARVKFDSHVTTIRGLLKQVQDQYLTSIPFESVGPGQMIEVCTDWPKWTRYSTSVNHQNYADAGLDGFALDEHTTCRVTYQELESDRRDIQVYSWPIQNDEMKIALAFCNSVLSKDLIQDLTNQLAAEIQYLASGIEDDELLTLDFTPSTSSSRIPRALVDVESVTSAVCPRRLALSFAHLDSQSLVDTVWIQFMALPDTPVQTSSANGNGDPAERLPSSTPFYEFGGDLAYAAQLSQFYREAAIEFSIEDLTKRPTREDQMAAIKRLLESE